jgi:hypothetical protein
LTAQKRFEALCLLEVPEVVLGHPLLGGLPTICIELLANIAAAKGRKASITDEIQKVRLRLCPVVKMAQTTPPNDPFRCFDR